MSWLTQKKVPNRIQDQLPGVGGRGKPLGVFQDPKDNDIMEGWSRNRWGLVRKRPAAQPVAQLPSHAEPRRKLVCFQQTF